MLDKGNTPDVLNLKGRLGAIDDLNNYTQTGVWHQDGNTYTINGQNYPVGYAGLLTLVAVLPMIYQTCRISEPTDFGDATFTRGYFNGVWSAWNRLRFA